MGGKERAMAVPQPSRKETTISNKRSLVRTSVYDGRKYVKSDELIKSKKVQEQIEKLQKIVESRP